MDNKKKKKESYQNFVLIIIILFEIKMGQIILFTFVPPCVLTKNYFQIDQTTSFTLYILCVTTGHSLFNSMINIHLFVAGLLMCGNNLL